MKGIIWLSLLLCAQVLGKNIETQQQYLVENGLRAPVSFQNEQLKTYSVSQRLAHYKVPSISFALIDNGELSWAGAYGIISAQSSEMVTTTTIFQAASIAKPVSAYAVMRMAEQGKVDINRDINEYLTSITVAQSDFTNQSKITFKNLLDHTSGITPGGYLGYTQDEKIPSDVQTFLGLKPANVEQANVETIPGTSVAYSGAGYTLAEIALSDIFDKPFEETMEEYVLSPLKMNQSTFFMQYPNDSQYQVALGHDSNGEIVAGGWRIHPEQAAAGLWSTPTDLAKFAISLSKAFGGNNKLLSESRAREMLTRILPGKDLEAQFAGHPAMTFVVSGEGQEFLFKHSGGTIGYRSFLIMYPHTGDGAVFMTNSDSGFSVGMEMLRAAADTYNWPDYNAVTYERRKADRKEQTSFLGEYRFDIGWNINVISIAEADGLGILFPNGDIYPLTAVSGEHSYIHTESGVEVKFTISANSTSIMLYEQMGVKSS